MFNEVLYRLRYSRKNIGPSYFYTTTNTIQCFIFNWTQTTRSFIKYYILTIITLRRFQ